MSTSALRFRPRFLGPAVATRAANGAFLVGDDVE